MDYVGLSLSHCDCLQLFASVYWTTSYCIFSTLTRKLWNIIVPNNIKNGTVMKHHETMFSGETVWETFGFIKKQIPHVAVLKIQWWPLTGNPWTGIVGVRMRKKPRCYRFIFYSWLFYTFFLYFFFKGWYSLVIQSAMLNSPCLIVGKSSRNVHPFSINMFQHFPSFINFPYSNHG